MTFRVASVADSVAQGGFSAWCLQRETMVARGRRSGASRWLLQVWGSFMEQQWWFSGATLNGKEQVVVAA